MNNYNQHKQMIRTVAEALGPDLCKQMAFVGGSTTGLLLTDTVTQEDIRYTTDVDLIIHVVGRPGWDALRQQLEGHNFKVSMEDDVFCRLRLGELKVDFMPDDPAVMGFSNRWYSAALESATDFELEDGIVIRLLTPPYFLATKFEAYHGRGNEDLLTSHDIEDVMNLINGREELLCDVRACDDELRTYIADQIQQLIDSDDCDYLLQDVSRGDTDRADIIYERLEALASLGAEC